MGRLLRMRGEVSQIYPGSGRSGGCCWGEDEMSRQPLDAIKLADEIEALRNSDDEYDFICNITSYHLSLFAQGLRLLAQLPAGERPHD